MWYLFIIVYNIVFVPLFYIGFYVGALFNAKMKAGLKGRKGNNARIKQLASQIPAQAQVFLFHSSSVGEWEQAVPVIEAMKQNDPNIFVIVTFFSPSGFNVVNNPIIDAKLYLPFDSVWNAKLLFAQCKPKAWIICKYDVWPNMLAQAKKNNIPVFLASAELAADSQRHIFPMSLFNKMYYAKIDYIFPVSDDTSERFLHIFPHPERLIVTGDSRFDRIYQKVQKVILEPEITIFKNVDGFAFIMGSSWQQDEAVILPPLIRLMQKYSHLQLIFVPHEIHEKHIVGVESLFKQANIATERYTSFSQNNGTHARVAIIDTVGILSKLYKISKIAYVGGGFDKGVHNVMEPAAFAQPVLFGPKHENSYEACQLVKHLAAHSINNENDFEIIVTFLMENETFRQDKGYDARKFLLDNLGSTEKTLDFFEKLGLLKVTRTFTT